jgi:hypothetical protein
MKRKLIKRNKIFLSGRIHKYDSNFSFQCLTSYCFEGKDRSEKVRVKRIWKWFYSSEYLNKMFGDALITDFELGDE